MQLERLPIFPTSAFARRVPCLSCRYVFRLANSLAHFSKCESQNNVILQLYALFLRSQVSAFFGQSSAVRPPVFHNLLLSAFPLLISEAPLRRALVSKWSELGGNVKVNLAALADPQNRDALEQIKILHKAVSLLQVRFVPFFFFLCFNV